MTLNTAYQALRQNVAGLAQWTQDQLTELASAIATGWNVEHDGEGHHTAITGASATLTGRCRCGRFSVSGVLDLVLTADVTTIWTPANIATAGHLRVTGGFTVYGLSVLGRSIGDTLIFANANQSVDSIGLRLQASTLSGQDGTFRGNGSTPDTDITIDPGRFVTLLVDKNTATGTRTFWRVSQF